MFRPHVFVVAVLFAFGFSAVEPLLLTPEEVGEALGIRRTTVYEMLRRGEIPSFKLGRLRRIARADLEAFVMGQTRVTATPEPPTAGPAE